MIYRKNMCEAPYLSDKFLTDSIADILSQEGLDKNAAFLFYDIETTGFSPHTSQIYLIGAVTFENNQWYAHQWLDDSGLKEKEVLSSFLEFLKDYDIVFHFNGNRFDQPFLKERAELHGLPFSLNKTKSFDFLNYIRPLKEFLKLDHIKQSEIENFLSLPPRKYSNGKKCIQLYKKYITSQNEAFTIELLGHNYEDLIRLIYLIHIKKYYDFLHGNFEIAKCYKENETLIFNLELPNTLPKDFSIKTSEHYISTSNNHVGISVKLHNERVKQFHTNYKDYHYIPSEDTAIPKILSKYLDKELKQPAILSNCYTWFTCTELFLNDNIKQRQFILNILNYITKKDIA